jgi:hypothetical protein
VYERALAEARADEHRKQLMELERVARETWNMASYTYPQTSLFPRRGTARERDGGAST